MIASQSMVATSPNVKGWLSVKTLSSYPGNKKNKENNRAFFELALEIVEFCPKSAISFKTRELTGTAVDFRETPTFFSL